MITSLTSITSELAKVQSISCKDKKYDFRLFQVDSVELIYNKVHARKMTMMMSDDVQLYNLSTSMGKVAHSHGQIRFKPFIET